MTTPVAPTGANNSGSTAGNLSSGAMGTLGTNVLQQDITVLSTRVQDLTTAVNNLVSNIQTSGSSGGLGGQATRQQGPANATSGFPKMVNPSRMQAQTSGGNGGYGNMTSGMSSGGYSSNRSLYSGNGGFASGLIATAGAFAGYGAKQAQQLVPLNSFATQSLTGYNYNGMSQNQAMNQLYGQAGALPGKQLSIGSGSLTDNIAMAQTLQQVSGSANPMQNAKGRAATGAALAFGITNPNLSAASAGQQGAGLYSQQMSLNMLRLGYGQTVLSRAPGGVNMNGGQAAQAILKGMNLSKATSSQVRSAFASGGVAQQNLNYLTQGTGITSSAMQQYLTDYAQLINNKGMTATQATNLFTQAASGSSAQMKAARATLSKNGIATANNDLAALVGNQAAQTGRAGDVASGFNSGLQQSAGLLTEFNNALNSLLKGPLGTALGYSGGALGTVAGSALGSGTNMLGTAGSYMMMKKLFSKGGNAASAAATAGESEVTADAIGAGGASSLLGPLGLILGGGIVGGAALNAVNTKLANRGAPPIGASGAYLKFLSSQANKGSNPAAKALNKGVVTLPQGFSIGGMISSMWNDVTHPGAAQLASPAAGPQGAPIASAATQQNKTGGNSQAASVSSSAKKAVSAAESQSGVPYQYGAELPGVGFDCSSLIQWAYKQAGVSLPRTSQQQWSALSKKSVPMDKLQEGDIVFAAGSDGTNGAPGHVGLMVNSHQVIQAAHSGTKIGVSGYSASDWSHAARPSGSGAFIAGQTASVSGTGTAGATAVGNTGAKTSIGGGGLGGSYGSVNEVDVIGGMGGSSGGGGGARTSNGAPNTGAANGTSGSSNTNTGGGSVKPGVQPSSSKAELMAKAIAQKYGWSTGPQWQAFLNVVGAEDASWSLTAKNPTSTAYGIAQFINGPQDYYKYGGNPNNVQGQVTGMMNYIKQRYKTPEAAWNFHKANGWYAAGGTTAPGLAVVGERGPELMMQGGGNQVFSNAQTMQLINSIRGSSPAQSPWKTDITSGHSNGTSQSSPINVTFGTNSINITASGTSTQVATQSAREVQRAIVKQLSHASIHQAIKQGAKL